MHGTIKNKNLKINLRKKGFIFFVILIVFFMLDTVCKNNFAMAVKNKDEKNKKGVLMNIEDYSKDLEFKIITDKEVYKKGETIKVAFSITNKGSHDLLLNTRMFLNSEDSPITMREIYLKIVSPSGKEIPFLSFIEVGYPTRDDFESLKSSNTTPLKGFVDLTQYYNFEETGTYEIVAVYENQFAEELNIDAWKGKIESTPIKIEIVQTNER